MFHFLSHFRVEQFELFVFLFSLLLHKYIFQIPEHAVAVFNPFVFVPENILFNDMPALGSPERRGLSFALVPEQREGFGCTFSLWIK